MKALDVHRSVFKNGSKTYFNSSIFFPRQVREEVFILYGFVRTADNFVDSEPQDSDGFYRFREQFASALAGTPAGDPIIDSFAELHRKRGFEAEWTEAFLHSMEMDLHHSRYESLEETLGYIYGSAEVIGLYMARIMRLPPEADQAACMLGRSMQYINFIRDIAEDNRLGRRYLPLEDSELLTLDEDEAQKKPEAFRAFINRQTARYKEWQTLAEEGYPLIPRSYRVPIKTAGKMYTWSAGVIEKDPFVVYRRKVKPSKPRILASIIRDILTG